MKRYGHEKRWKEARGIEGDGGGGGLERGAPRLAGERWRGEPIRVFIRVGYLSPPCQGRHPA